MQHYETTRKLWRDIFIALFLFTVLYVLASFSLGYSGSSDIFIKYTLVITTFFSAVRYFSLIGMEGANYDATSNISRFEARKKTEIEKTVKQNPDVFVKPEPVAEAPVNLAIEPISEDYPLVEPMVAVSETNVEPIVIERPVYKEVVKEIVVERPVYVEKVVEREIVVEKPVIKEKEVSRIPEHSEQSFVVGNEETKRETKTRKQDSKTKTGSGHVKSGKQNNQLKEQLEKIVADEKEKERTVEKKETKPKKYLPELQSELRAVADPEKKKKQEDFFQAEEGEYAEGDTFLGVKLSDVLKLSEQYKDLLDNGEVKKLLGSNVHEERLTGIWVLIKRYEATNDAAEKTSIYDFYVKNRKLANNWDLVDLAARNIVGPELVSNNDKDGILTSFAAADSIWDQRTAVMATTSFLNTGDLSKSFLVAERLSDSKEDLIQSSVGWILKEAYKRDADEVEQFLINNFDTLPSQSIRIATEKMEKKKRKEFLKGNFEA